MIRVHTLGGLSVRDGDGKPLVGPATQPRRIAILALLARAGDRGLSRDRVLALLWPDADDERGPRALAQALYALRRHLGADNAIEGAKELRFDPALVSSDIGEFASAVSRGDDERAVSLYHGPFLDGFHLNDADEFARWVDRERAALASDYSRALESLARSTRAAGDARASVGWWRKLAAIEPLNARVTVGLMDALAADGDRAGALQHARIYELLVEQELDLPPDRDVFEYAQRLRQTPEPSREPAREPPRRSAAVAEAPQAAPELAVLRPPAPSQGAAPEITPPPASVTTVSVASDATAPSRQRGWLRPVLVGVAALGIAGVALVATQGRLTSGTSASADGRQVVAVGHIVAFGTDSTPANLTAPVADLLTTSLARVPGIRVVSRGRMLELMRTATSTDTGPGAVVNAARQAGATEVIDGTLYTRGGGRLRLDLRRIDLATGAIGDVHTVEGSDLFALVDSGTVRLVASLGVAAPPGSVADITTRSLTAYRMYEQGVRAYYRGDARTALSFFDSALAEDSLFALAAYYGALSDPVTRSYDVRMERARRLADRASDRERLTILAGWARSVSSPALRPIAETLATRYPNEVEGHLNLGIARVLEGEFIAALTSLQRVVAMDSLGLRGARPRCAGCDALQWIVGAYALADSMPAAEREARRWMRLQPGSETAAVTLVQLLQMVGRGPEADSIFQATAPRDMAYASTIAHRAINHLRAGDYAAADRLLLTQLRESAPQLQAIALWNLTISYREQGRLLEAYDAAKRTRAANAKTATLPEGVLSMNVLEAQTLLELGRATQAAALFDSIARQHAPTAPPSQRARGTAWMLTHAAGARLAAGDTTVLARLADSIRTLGRQSNYGRDQRLHHYVRGLLLAGRGDDRAAIAELTASIYSLTSGFTRTNYELARLYLRTGRPRDAISVLQPALRGPLDASNLYMNRMELHERLAQAWDSAGARDSAVAHYEIVARVWSAGDDPFKQRADRARLRAASLRR